VKQGWFSAGGFAFALETQRCKREKYIYPKEQGWHTGLSGWNEACG
jgi:hypothetical protein